MVNEMAFTHHHGSVGIACHEFPCRTAVRDLLRPAAAQVCYDAICSTRGVEHKPLWVSDDFVVACIMVMFLFLFAFGKQ